MADLAFGIAGLVSLTIQIAAVSTRYISVARGATKAQYRYLSELHALSTVLVRFAQSIDNLEARNVSVSRNQVHQCEEELHHLQRELEGKVQRSGIPSALKWPFEEKGTREIIDMLHRWRDIFSSVLSADIFDIVVKTHRDIKDSKQGQIHREILDYLAHPAPLKTLSISLKQLCPGTGRWLLKRQEYLDWRDGPTNCLWLYGDPGIGKTFLASLVVDDLRGSVDTSNYCVMHYSFHGCGNDPECIQNVLRNILQQGLENVQSMPTKVLFLRPKFRKPNTPSLSEFVDALTATCSGYTESFLVLDGMDECIHRSKLLPVLRSLKKSGIRVLLTSRFLPEIQDAYVHDTLLCVRAAKEDVELYVTGRLQELDCHDSLNAAGLDKEIAAKVTNHADGIFLLARLAMDQLHDCTKLKQVRQTLASLPSALPDAYEESISRILKQSPPRVELAKRVISWILAARRPLAMDELRHGLAIEEGASSFDVENLDTAKTLISVCLGLVTANESDGTITFVHSTLYECLSRLEYDWLHKGHIDIAKVCLTYLSYTELATGPCGNVQQLQDRIQSLPFLQYAASYWGEHASIVEPDLIYLLLTFAQEIPLIRSSFQVIFHRIRSDKDLTIRQFESLPRGQEPMTIASYWNFYRTAAKLLDQGSRVSCPDSQGWAPLHWAASNGHLEVAELLLDHAADIDAQDRYGWTPLFWASFKTHANVASLLLHHGANADLKDTGGWTAHHWASTVEVQEVLLAYRSTIAIRTKDLTVEQAKQASQYYVKSQQSIELGDGYEEASDDPVEDNLRCDQYLQSCGELEQVSGELRYYNPRPRGTKSRRCKNEKEKPSREILLGRTIAMEKLPMIKVLLEQNVDPNATLEGDFGQREAPSCTRALHIAASCNNHEITKFLLEQGADPAAVDSAGDTALHIAIRERKELNAVKLAQNPMVNQLKNKKGYTPFLTLCASEQSGDSAFRIAKVLIDNEANVRVCDNTGKTALHLAVGLEDLSVMRLLLEEGVDPYARDETHQTWFHKFASYRYHGDGYKAFETLLEYQRSVFINFSIQCGQEVIPLSHEEMHLSHDAENQTPLSLALKAKNWCIASMLLDRGAQLSKKVDPSILTRYLFDAIEAGWPRIVKELIGEGAKLEESSYSDGSSPLATLVHQANYCWRKHDGKNFLLNGEPRGNLEQYLKTLTLLSNTYRATTKISPILRHAIEISAPTSIVLKLVDAGADLTLCSSGAHDILLLAAGSNNEHTLSYISQQLKLHHPASFWFSASSWSSSSGIDLIDTNTNPKEEYNAITFAQHISRMLKFEGSLEVRNEKGWTPLLCAADSGNIGFAAALLLEGADIQAEEPVNGYTPLFIACEKGHEGIVELLLSRGADVGKPSRPTDPNTPPTYPLHIATNKSHPKIVSLLLNHHTSSSTSIITSALHIAVSSIINTTTNYSGSDPLEIPPLKSTLNCLLQITALLIKKGADVSGIADEMTVEAVVAFEGFEGLWEVLRGAVSREGEWVGVW